MSFFLSSAAVAVGSGHFSLAEEPHMTNEKLLYRVDPGHIKMHCFSFPPSALAESFDPEKIKNTSSLSGSGVK